MVSIDYSSNEAIRVVGGKEERAKLEAGSSEFAECKWPDGTIWVSQVPNLMLSVVRAPLRNMKRPAAAQKKRPAAAKKVETVEEDEEEEEEEDHEEDQEVEVAGHEVEDAAAEVEEPAPKKAKIGEEDLHLHMHAYT